MRIKRITLINLLIFILIFFLIPCLKASADGELSRDDISAAIQRQNIKGYYQNIRIAKTGVNEKKAERKNNGDRDKREPFQPETVKVSANGVRIPLKIYRDENGNILIPIKDMDTGYLMKQFNARVTWLVPMKTVVLGLPGGKDFRVKIGEDKGLYGRKKVKLKSKVRIIDGSPCIPIECFQIAYRLDVSLNEVTHILYMDPIITKIDFKMEKGKLRLIAGGTGDLKFKTSMLTDPRRYVIEIEDAVLDSKLAGKYIRHRYIGSVFVSQDYRMPNRVKIVIPMKSGVEIEMQDDRKDKKLVVARLFFPEVVAPVQDLKIEGVTRFTLKKDEDKVTFYIRTTGPVQYEWRRLLPPDNRYFIDIPKTRFTAPEYNKELDVGYISSINVIQLRKKPEPVVRVTLNLEVPSKVVVEPDSKYPEVIKVVIFKKTINPRFVRRQGFGVTRMPVRGGIVICIDPGHGGGDPGACNSAYGLQEKHLNLDISLRLARLLRKAGWNVVMTRTTDRDVSFAGSSDARELGDRVAIPNNINAQIFVSIHNNAAHNSSQSGTSTHCYKDIDYPLAQAIQAHLVPALGRRDNGVRTDSFYVVRHTNMPAALVECAFISNPSEASLLASSSFRQQCAVGIFNGLMAYAKMRNLGRPMTPEDDFSVERKAEAKKREKIDKKIERSKPEADPDYGER